MAVAITGQSVVTGALKLLGVMGEGETPNADLLTDGLDRLNELIDALGTQRLATYASARSTFATTASLGTYAVGPGAAINRVRPSGFESVTYIAAGQTQEIRLTPYTAAMYASIPDKTITASAPYGYYYDPTSPTGSLVLIPTPTAAVTLVFYDKTLLTSMTLSGSVTLPAGYARMLRYQLAKAWAPEFGKGLDPFVDEAAREALADVKRANTGTPPPLTIDPAIGGWGGWYDINTDQP